MSALSTSRLLRRRAGRRLADLLDQLEVVVWEQPRRTQGLAYVNERVEQMLGVDSERFKQKGMWEALVHPEDLTRVLEAWARIDDEDGVECEYRMVRPDGAVVWVLELTQRLRRAGGRRGDALRGVLIDVTERVEAAESLRHLALHDSLTGLANRTYLRDRLEVALADAAANDGVAALLMMDLDQFKEVNDALGHHHGDLLLIELGSRIASLAPPGSTVARLGGDEFAVLLAGTHEEPATARGALELAYAIRRSLDEPAVIDGISLQSGVSIGVATFPEHGTDAETLTLRADIAMYKAKSTGIGVSLFLPDHDHSSARRLTLLGGLRSGIDEGQFVCHYQPRVDLATGDVVDVEALVRWQHPALGLVPPVEFIGLAEVSGAIQPLTEYILHTATSDIAALCEHGIGIGVAVNLSVRNLYDPGLLDSIVRAFGVTGLNPERLRVEITESEMMDDPALARGVLTHLRDQGIGISIDDFGTGYSSLAYLRDLPISEVKIDRSFVAAMTDGDPVLARSIIDLAHNLGLRAVAEGVETGPALQQLTRFGCDSAQGFFIARPMPIEELTTFLGRDGDHYRGWIRDGHQPAAEWEAPLTRR